MGQFRSEDSLGSKSPEEILRYERLVEGRENWEDGYLGLVTDILNNGDDRMDRTGVGTRALFGERVKLDLNDGFPVPTTKKFAFEAMKAECLWMVEGSGDERRLCEILHGTRDEAKRTIWTANAEAPYWKPKAKYPGDLGRVYGVQWRHWQKYVRADGSPLITSDGQYVVTEVDQLAEAIEKIKHSPYDRRMIVSMWNVGEMDEMALPPCPTGFQFFVEKGRLSCMMTQRSVDTGLGLPFDIACYALLTHMVAHVTGLGVGKLTINLGDTHIYHTHLDSLREQTTRVPFDAPRLWLNPDVKSIDDFTMGDIRLEGYQCHGAIKMDMAV